MISSYTIDTINKITYALDEWGKETRTSTPVNAYVDDQNKLVRNANGQEVMSNGVILVDSEDTSFIHENKIQILTRNGVASSFPSKEWAILKLSKIHSFSSAHWEIII